MNIATRLEIDKHIYIVRSHKVMLDYDLALLYGVETKVLKRAVKRNLDRFPGDFMFELSRVEYNSLRCQIGTLENGRGQYSKYVPFAFTEQGVAMLSSVLNSKSAIQVNIQIMRAFIRIREILFSYKELERKILIVERKHDKKFVVVFDALRSLLDGPEKKFRVKGFNRRSRSMAGPLPSGT